MIERTSCFSKIYLAPGYTDMRAGIDTLAAIIKTNYQLDPFEKNVLFLFCGRRSDRIKALLWEGNGFVLFYKRYESGSLTWPRTPGEAMKLTSEQYHLLLHGYSVVAARPTREVCPAGVV